MATLDRLKEFHSYLKSEGYGGRNVFEREIGVSEGYLSQAKRKGINSDVLEKIAETFPQLSMEWLITGCGEMILRDNFQPQEDTIVKLQEDLREAYMEIGRLNMKLKAAQEHKSSQKIV